MNKMGIVYSYFTNDDKVSKQDLSRLFQEIDKNRDDVITKNELDKYISKHLDGRMQEIEHCKYKYEMLLQDHQLLQEDYNKLKTKSQTQLPQSTISISAVKDYVQNEIMSSDANSKYIPDPIERKAYISIYKTLLESLTQLSNSTTLNILNHKVTIHLEPLEKYN